MYIDCMVFDIAEYESEDNFMLWPNSDPLTKSYLHDRSSLSQNSGWKFQPKITQLFLKQESCILISNKIACTFQWPTKSQ